jgi:hypothetical protein
MARQSGYAAATMTVTLSESISVNNRDYGSTQSFTVASVANIDRRIVSVSTTEVTLMTFDTVMSAGQSIPGKVKYIRFTNLDDTNFITLTFKNENNDECAIKLDAGNSFIWAGDNSAGMVDVMNATESADANSDVALGDMKDIQADANTAACDLEIFVAEVA